ncbi:MAG: QueT transporter family protein [Clostridia bacterium]|nr:QueT transporter family protein [Clostridia bacterium]
MKPVRNKTRILFVCQAGLIAAMYTALTLFVGAFGLANGAVQLRISEALCVLPFFTPAAIPGLTVGCLLSNLATGVWQDILFGTLATFLGAVGARCLRRVPWLVPLPTVLANTVIIPFVLSYAYGMEEGIPFLMLTVGIGEVLSAYVLGMVLLSVLKKSAGVLFRE